MENTITRIADLPIDNGQTSYSTNIPNSVSAGNNGGGGVPTNYIPMNVHPNPYGNPTGPIMPIPQQTSSPKDTFSMQKQVNFDLPPAPPQAQYLTEEQQAQLQALQHQRLPSRDIPMDTETYLHDEQVKANYIPKANLSSDYVRDYQDMTEKNVKEYEAKKRQTNRFDMILNEIQVPVIVAILFFLFQLPMINSMIFKRFSFLSIYNNDGNFNFTGLLLKSLLFGSAYYSISKITDFLSEL